MPRCLRLKPLAIPSELTSATLSAASTISFPMLTALLISLRYGSKIAPKGQKNVGGRGFLWPAIPICFKGKEPPQQNHDRIICRFADGKRLHGWIVFVQAIDEIMHFHLPLTGTSQHFAGVGRRLPITVHFRKADHFQRFGFLRQSLCLFSFLFFFWPGFCLCHVYQNYGLAMLGTSNIYMKY